MFHIFALPRDRSQLNKFFTHFEQRLNEIF